MQRTSAVALQSQISQVVLTLVLSDILDQFPRARFLIVNLGGVRAAAAVRPLVGCLWW